MADVSLLYEALTQKGIEPPKHIRPGGSFTRWGNNSRYYAVETRDNEGWIFGDWVEGWKETAFPHREQPLTPEEKERRRRQIVVVIRKIKAEQNKRWDDVAQKALNIWENATALENHEYLHQKRIKPYSARFTDYCAEFGGNGQYIVLPLRDTKGKIWSLEYINPQGDKRFLSGGRKKGCYCSIGKPENNKIIICEGFATGASVYEATGLAVAVAFDCGNLEPVLTALMCKYPDYDIGIAADNDIKENAPNTGLETAGRLKEKYSVKVYIPSFKEKQAKCDFNDLMAEEGKEAVKAVFLAADGVKTENSVLTPENRTETQKSPKPDGFPAGYRLTEKDLLYIGGDDDPVRVSGRVEVIAKTRDDNSQNWGKLLKFADPDGVLKEIAVPNTMFAADCRELRELLLSEGLDITPAGKSRLSTYLMSCNPAARTLCINKTGWYKNAFVFPDSVIGELTDKISFQAESFNNVYTTAGSLDDWRENIGQYCSGNSRLIFAVSAAFAGALLYKSGLESGGFHFVGGSSCGKSTILRAAASVWGGKDYLRTWRTTDNGLEGVASMYNDSLLILDELGQVDPGKAGEIAYMLGNGGGKTRATRNGTARNALSWRLLYLSSGEKDLSDCAEESKKKVRAGQEVRLLNIPACPVDRESYGAFESLHGLETGGGFAEYLNRQTKEYYGTPARAFIKAITAENPEAIKNGIYEDLNKIKEGLSETIAEGEADTQAKRAINRFALVAFAGEYATEKGLTGWETGEALNAVSWCLKDWLTARGGVGNQEDRQILEQVKYFFEQHAENGFYDLTAGNNQKIINIVGYKDKICNKWEYYILPGIFKKDICKGLNLNLAKDVLTKKGWLKSKTSTPKRVQGEVKKVYVFTSDLWGEEC